MHNPKVSVLMPVYNTKEEYLRESIESILNQTFTDFELIIINDGSNNNVEEVILSYKDERIKYIKNEKNLGLSKTRNKLLELANGDLIALMDSDDISLSTRFEKQVAFLEKNEDISVLGSWFRMFPNGIIVKHPIENNRIKDFFLFIGSAIGNPTTMMRKSIFDKFHFKYNEEFKSAEDYGLWLSMLDKVKFANLPEVLLNYRWHESNTSTLESKISRDITTKLMIEYQTKYVGKEFQKEIDIYTRVRDKGRINSSEFIQFINYLEKIIEKTTKDNCKNMFRKEYAALYKNAAKNCKRDYTYVKTLWNNNINKFVKYGFYFRLKNTLRGWR